MTANSSDLSILRLTRSAVVSVAALVSACASAGPIESALPGTFANPPRPGALVAPRVGSVVCLNELDALAMARTGFFTQSCQTLSAEMTLVAESVVRVDAGEGPVIMIRTTFEGQVAWVPIPWHDWA